MLIKAGAGLNVKNKDGNTPLILAAWRGYIEMGQLLIKAGADINIQNKGGYTPLILSVKKNKIEWLKC